MSPRARLIDLYTRVYNGTLYDHLKYFYFQEREGGNNGNYIPINLRQPSVKVNLCKLVVDDSVSLLFGSDHFPSIRSEDSNLREELEEIATFYKINAAMTKAATIGSTGSVAIFLKVFEGVLNIECKNTKYLTPIFDKKNPTKLVKLTEKYKVTGQILIDQGYTGIDNPKKKYWFQREWDNNSEIYYLPYPTDKKDVTLIIDKNNSFTHGLGFVPILWVKNLPKINDSDENGIVIDGACTFSSAIDTNCEIDYQLSQAGRALKYSADPLLVLKLEDDMQTLTSNSVGTTVDALSGGMGGLVPGAPLMDNGGTRGISRSASNALILNPDDEAKMLEISGDACAAVREYVRDLREYLLESIHGNRSNADKVNAAQSGKAMQAMNQSLIWLTDHLRVSYGENGYLELLKMIIAITNKPGFGILVNGKLISKLNDKEPISLDWPAWYPDTPSERLQSASAIKTLSDGGFISKETGTKSISDDYGIENFTDEAAKIAADQEKVNALNPKVTEIQNI